MLTKKQEQLGLDIGELVDLDDKPEVLENLLDTALLMDEFNIPHIDIIRSLGKVVNSLRNTYGD